MTRSDWTGVFPAITTPFRSDQAVDYDFLREHVVWLINNGCQGIVPLGSLGEGATLTFDEKVRILEVCREVLSDHAPLVPGISGVSTAECVALARAAEKVGCDGLMVLPPYIYEGEWRETEFHFKAVIEATPLSCMLYNNPIAYGTDLTAEHISTLARYENVHAVKESSGDIRRVTQLRAAVDDRLAIFVGIDDMIVEGIAAGATGWVAGLVNALPEESVRLYDLAMIGREEARELYEWFLPLLRLDVGPKFVQQIKLVQEAVGRGGTVVRPPRLALAGEDLERTRAIIQDRLGQPAAV